MDARLKKFFDERTSFNPDADMFDFCEQVSVFVPGSYWNQEFGSGEFLEAETFGELNDYFLSFGVTFVRQNGLMRLCCDSSTDRSEGISTDYFGGKNLFLKVVDGLHMCEVTVHPGDREPHCADYHVSLVGYCDDCRLDFEERLKEKASLKLDMDRKKYVDPSAFELSFVYNKRIVPSVNYEPYKNFDE